MMWITNHKFLIILFFFFAMQPKGHAADPLRGYWQGPHPEWAHVHFVIHLDDLQHHWQATGYWLNQNIVQDSFSVDSVSRNGEIVAFYIPRWRCWYRGKLMPNDSTIYGSFACTGEPDDAVNLRRIERTFIKGLEQGACSGTGKQQLPAIEPGGFPVALPQSVGLSFNKLNRFASELQSGHSGIYHSVVIVKNGRLVFERYFRGFTKNDLHPLESVTKSVVALLTGLALENESPGIEHTAIGPLLAKQYPNPDLMNLTWHQLLTMSSGLRVADESALLRPGRIPYLLQLKPVAETVGQFNYQAVNSELLGYLIKQKSGYAVDSLAASRLFSGLGINQYDWQTFRQQGYPLCGGALWLRPRAMARIGQLVLDGGRWAGKQLIPSRWLDKLTKEQIRTGVGNDTYGYQWWITHLQTARGIEKMVWANGLGSQFIFIFPRRQMVLVTTGGNWAGGNDGKSWDILDGLAHLLEAIDE